MNTQSNQKSTSNTNAPVVAFSGRKLSVQRLEKLYAAIGDFYSQDDMSATIDDLQYLLNEWVGSADFDETDLKARKRLVASTLRLMVHIVTVGEAYERCRNAN